MPKGARDMKQEKHSWEFAPRFRARAFGWRSQVAVPKVRQAVAEIKKVAKGQPMVAADGAVLFLEKVSRALEQVDSSSGALGAAVRRGIDELVPCIVQAPADDATRERWLERLYKALLADDIPYIEHLEEHWGALCLTPERAGAWAERLLPGLRQTLGGGEYATGTTACLASLLAAGRYRELLDLLATASFLIWGLRRFGTLALVALGEVDAAIAYAEASMRENPPAVAAQCEAILLEAGRSDEAYTRFAFIATTATTRLAIFRAVARKYPKRDPLQILHDLIASTPGEEGKWFATARQLGNLELAVKLALESPCDPKTLIRAAVDLEESHPAEARLLAVQAIHWIAAGWGYEITGDDVYESFGVAVRTAEELGLFDETQAQLEAIQASDAMAAGFVKKVLSSSWVLDRVLGHRAR